MKKAWRVLEIVVLVIALLPVSSSAQRAERHHIKLVTTEVSLRTMLPGLVVKSLVVVSPDSKHLACGAQRGDTWLVVVDGEAGPAFDRILGEPTFSPDSKHLAYRAVRGDTWLVVVDGGEGPAYDGFPEQRVFLREMVLVFDSPNILHTVAYRGEEFFRVTVEIVEE